MAEPADRSWAEAGAARITELAATIDERVRDVRDGVGVDAVHDMRTATRRLRTAIEVYAADAGKRRRVRVERTLKRAARRLGAVRDLDILLAALEDAGHADGDGELDGDDLRPLREAWQDERASGASRLLRAIRPSRLDPVLDDVRRLVKPGDDSTRDVVHRVGDRAPGLVWNAYGDVLAFELDPATADPARIHECRKVAKRLRYTLEAFEDALAADGLIDDVTAVQDAGGEMHDAIVAAQRAREALDDDHLSRPERRAIEAFATSQDHRAEAQRPVVDRCLGKVRGRAFRRRLGRAVADMGRGEEGADDG